MKPSDMTPERDETAYEYIHDRFPQASTHEPFAGYVDIYRPSGCFGQRIEVRIRDQASRLIVARFVMNPGDFAMALTGMGEVPCRFMFNPSESIGRPKHVNQ